MFFISLICGFGVRFTTNHHQILCKCKVVYFINQIFGGKFLQKKRLSQG